MYERYVIDDFGSGVNKQGADEQLATGEYRSGVNLRIRGRHLMTPGAIINAFSSRPAQVLSFTRHVPASGISYIVFAMYHSGIWSYREDTAAFVQIYTDTSLADNVSFASYAGNLYIAIPGNALRVWTGTGTIVRAGVTAPTTILTVPSQAAGAITDTNVQYYYTRVNDRGIESDPSPASIAVNDSAQENVLSIPSYTPPTGEVVASVNIYRKSTAVPTALKAGSVAFVSGSALSFTDNIGNASLSATPVPVTNALPPMFSHIYVFDNRLWGFVDKGTSLYVSSKGDAEHFPINASDVNVYGTRIDIDTSYDDHLIALSSTGAALIAARMHSMFSLLWNGSTYTATKVSSVGTIFPKTVKRADNHVYWLGRDMAVYRVGISGNDVMSEPIKDTLRSAITFSPYSLLAPCAAYHENKYILVCPIAVAGTPLVFAFSEEKLSWEDYSNSIYTCLDIQSLTSITTGRPDLMIAPYGEYGVTSTYIDVSGAHYFGVTRIFADTTTSKLPIDFLTDRLNFGYSYRRKRLNRIVIEGVITQSSPAVTVTITSDAGRVTGMVYNTVLDSDGATFGIIMDKRIPASLVGDWFSLQLHGNASFMKLFRITFYWTLLEE